MRTPTYTAAQVADALKATGGLAALAAEKLGCTARTVYNYAEEYASVRDVMTHQKEKRIDIAEGQLWRLVQEGNLGAIIFFLKTQGKARGFTERHEVAGPDGGPIHTHTQTQVEHGLSPDFFAAVVRILGEADADPGALETGEAATAASV